MGIFGGDASDEQQEANRLVQEQLQSSAADIEAKRQSLYQTRLDIIKGSGGQSFVPDRTVSASSRAGGSKNNKNNGLPDVFRNFFRH